MRIGFSKFKEKEKKTFEKKRFETTLSRYPLNPLDFEKNIIVGTKKKLFFVIFDGICPILDYFGHFSSVLQRYGPFWIKN